MINALVTTFAGLPTLAVQVLPTTTIANLHNLLSNRLPHISGSRLLLSTSNGELLSPSSITTISSLVNHDNDFLSLRLSATLVGGKGGFGSQLRAAGGRMSSRKKRGQEENSDSCRNLDGRRIRTVKEAKALAAYLEIKPEMDRKEKEKRKERLLKVIEMADKREAEEAGEEVIGGKKFDDVKWLEQIEEEKERTREAVLKAMREGAFGSSYEAGSSGTSSGDDDEEQDQEESSTRASGVMAVSKPRTLLSEKKSSAPIFVGFDDDDEFMSSDEENEDEKMEDTVAETGTPLDAKGKGKA